MSRANSSISYTQRMENRQLKKSLFYINSFMDKKGKAKFKCRYCFRDYAFENMTVDHITARALGGAHSIENMACACRTCNHEKSHVEGIATIAYRYRKFHNAQPGEPQYEFEQKRKAQLDGETRKALEEWREYLKKRKYKEITFKLDASEKHSKFDE